MGGGEDPRTPPALATLLSQYPAGADSRGAGTTKTNNQQEKGQHRTGGTTTTQTRWTKHQQAPMPGPDAQTTLETR